MSATIPCPQCGARTRVVASRPAPNVTVRRHRQCPQCGDTFTTYEAVAVRKGHPVAQDPHLSVRETAAKLGIGVVTTYEQIRVGRIPAWRINGRMWVPKTWVDDAVAGRNDVLSLRADCV